MVNFIIGVGGGKGDKILFYIEYWFFIGYLDKIGDNLLDFIIYW